MNVSEIRPTPAHTAAVSGKPSPTGFEDQLRKVTPRALGQQQATEAQEQPAPLTRSERDYFEQLFPDAADEVRTYNPFRRDNTAPARVGTLIDRKG
jgi:hypothetical protein